MPRAGLGQGRDCFGLRGEGRFEILKPAWREWDREKTRTSAHDPLQSLFDSCLPFPPLIEFLARDLILHETPMRLEAGAGVN